jgi:ATP-dependent Clp protease ATP-binding subunit ClpA
MLAFTVEACMFEHYTEKARRVIFYARYECSELGSPMIRSEHLLLGILRESEAIVALHLKVDPSDLATRLKNLSVGAEKLSTRIDLPLDDGAKRALDCAAEEAARMGHQLVGTEHLLLGIMREGKEAAAQMLRTVGAPGIVEVRKSVSDSASEAASQSGRSPSLPHHSPSIRVIEIETGRKLLQTTPSQAIPRIGEAVLLMAPGEADRRYRVIDVQWEYEQALRGIVVRVRQEEFVQD